MLMILPMFGLLCVTHAIRALSPSLQDVNNAEKTSVDSERSLKAQSQPTPTKMSLNSNQSTTMHSGAQPSTSDTSNAPHKNMSKAAVLRHLFFSQISSNNSNANESSNKLNWRSRDTTN